MIIHILEKIFLFFFPMPTYSFRGPARKKNIHAKGGTLNEVKSGKNVINLIYFSFAPLQFLGLPFHYVERKQTLFWFRHHNDIIK